MSVPKSVHDAYKSVGMRVPAGATLAKNRGGRREKISNVEQGKARMALQTLVHQHEPKGAAKLLGLHANSIHNVLRGHRRIGREMAEALAKHSQPALTIVKDTSVNTVKRVPADSDDVNKLVAPLLEVLNERDRLLARLSVIDGVLARVNSAATSTPRKLRAVETF